MGLSCSCGDFDLESYSWLYYPPNDFSILRTKRSRSCSSCARKIQISQECLLFKRVRAAKCDVEERIFGEEVPLSPHYMCEECGEIWLNLNSIGYCPKVGENMKDVLCEYWDKTGFDPKKYEPA